MEHPKKDMFPSEVNFTHNEVMNYTVNELL